MTTMSLSRAVPMAHRMAVHLSSTTYRRYLQCPRQLSHVLAYRVLGFRFYGDCGAEASPALYWQFLQCTGQLSHIRDVHAALRPAELPLWDDSAYGCAAVVGA